MNDERCDLQRAVERIETSLAEAPFSPFFGSAPHHELPLLAESLAQQGSKLRPRVVQRGPWYELEVDNHAETRRCRVHGLSVTFLDPTGRLDTSWPTREEVARSIRRYCENGAPAAEIAKDQPKQNA